MRAASILGGSILLMLAAASPAGAEVIEGPCFGDVEFTTGAFITESTPLSEVVPVPLEDTVMYYGNTTLDPPGEPVPFSGSVALALPLGFEWVIADWPNPPGETEKTISSGSYTYEVPEFVPEGTGAFELIAEHTQQGQTCIVAVAVSVDGNPGTVAILGGVGTVIFGAGVLGAGFKRKVL